MVSVSNNMYLIAKINRKSTYVYVMYPVRLMIGWKIISTPAKYIFVLAYNLITVLSYWPIRSD